MSARVAIAGRPRRHDISTSCPASISIEEWARQYVNDERAGKIPTYSWDGPRDGTEGRPNAIEPVPSCSPTSVPKEERRRKKKEKEKVVPAYLGAFPPSRTEEDHLADAKFVWSNAQDVQDTLLAVKRDQGWVPFLTAPFDRFQQDVISAVRRHHIRDFHAEKVGKVVTVHMSNIRLEDPAMIESDGYLAAMWPHDASGRKHTYAAPLTLDLSVIVRKAGDSNNLLHQISTHRHSGFN